MQLQLQYGQEALLFVTQSAIIPAAVVQLICAFEEQKLLQSQLHSSDRLQHAPIIAAVRLCVCSHSTLCINPSHPMHKFIGPYT